jgi:hypothetical protein
LIGDDQSLCSQKAEVAWNLAARRLVLEQLDSVVVEAIDRN